MISPGWTGIPRRRRSWKPRWTGCASWTSRIPEYEEEYGDHDELTAEELAEIQAAAADEVLAVAAAITGPARPRFPGRGSRVPW